MKDITDITIVLDRSGSMSGLVKEVISGFNDFLKTQKAIKDKEAYLSLFQFDSVYNSISEPRIKTYNHVNIQDVAELVNGDFTAGGMTALNDAIGKTINNVGARLAAMQESDRPNKVLLIFYTDGLENASKEFTLNKVNEMIKHQTDVYNWEIQFIGSTLDAQKQVDSYVTPGYTKMGLNQASNTRSAFAGVSNSVVKARNSTDAAAYKFQLESDALQGKDAFN